MRKTFKAVFALTLWFTGSLAFAQGAWTGACVGGTLSYPTMYRQAICKMTANITTITIPAGSAAARLQMLTLDPQGQTYTIAGWPANVSGYEPTTLSSPVNLLLLWDQNSNTWVSSSLGTAGGNSSGTPGPPGPSAYDVAVANGFTGTQSQWLTQLIGPQGIPGTNGAQGVPGPAGSGFIFQGDWVANTAYPATSVVVYNAQAYVTKVDLAAAPSFSGSDWKLFTGVNNPNDNTQIHWAQGLNGDASCPAQLPSGVSQLECLRNGQINIMNANGYTPEVKSISGVNVPPPDAYGNVVLSGTTGGTYALGTGNINIDATAGTNGVTAGTIVVLSGGTTKATASTPTTSSGYGGVALTTAGAGAATQVARSGYVTLSFDGTPAQGDIVIPSTTTIGLAHDSGVTTRASIDFNQTVVGQVISVNSQSALVSLFPVGTTGMRFQNVPGFVKFLGDASANPGFHIPAFTVTGASVTINGITINTTGLPVNSSCNGNWTFNTTNSIYEAEIDCEGTDGTWSKYISTNHALGAESWGRGMNCTSGGVCNYTTANVTSVTASSTVTGQNLKPGETTATCNSTVTGSAAVAIDTVTLTGNCTLTLPAGYQGQFLLLQFVQNSTGGYTVTPSGTNILGFNPVGTTASKRSSQLYFYSLSQAAWVPVNLTNY